MRSINLHIVLELSSDYFLVMGEVGRDLQNWGYPAFLTRSDGRQTAEYFQQMESQPSRTWPSSNEKRKKRRDKNIEGIMIAEYTITT